MASLRYILKQISQTENNEIRTYKEELEIIVNSLTSDERAYLNKKFCQLEWGNNSLNVLSILQNCRVLTATEYILSQDDVEHVQSVLNDCLEFKIELFANFLQNCVLNSMNVKILELILEDFLRQLLNDLCDNPNVIKGNYLKALKPLLLDEVYNSLISLHFQILFRIDKCKIKEAFNNCTTWKDTVPKNTTFSSILEELIANKEETLNIIIRSTSNSDFVGWKYFVILLQLLSESCSTDDSSLLRKHLKDLFKNFLIRCDDRACLELFITARTINSDLISYSQWFKSSFGEMTYTITADKFKDVMILLNRILNLESETTYIQTQANIAISAPILCNEIVFNYKRNCRIRLSELEKKNSGMIDLNESIIIDDDDD